MKGYLWIKYELKPKMSSKEPTIGEIAVKLAEKIEKIWNNASLPTVTRTRVLQLIRTYRNNYRNLLKPYKTRKTNNNYLERLKKLTDGSRKLFDISYCKYVCFESCLCPKAVKVSKPEWTFLIDQRTARNMIIGTVDMSSVKLKSRKRKKSARKRLEYSEEELEFTGSPISSSLPFHSTDEENNADLWDNLTEKSDATQKKIIFLFLKH